MDALGLGGEMTFDFTACWSYEMKGCVVKACRVSDSDPVKDALWVEIRCRQSGARGKRARTTRRRRRAAANEDPFSVHLSLSFLLSLSLWLLVDAKLILTVHARKIYIQTSKLGLLWIFLLLLSIIINLLTTHHQLKVSHITEQVRLVL